MPNVLFVDAKVAVIQRMIAVKPDKFITPTTGKPPFRLAAVRRTAAKLPMAAPARFCP
jgi:hypothetical protein